MRPFSHNTIHTDRLCRRKKPFKSEKNKKTGKNHLQETATDDVGTDTPRGSRQSTPEVNGSKTEAEKRFEEMQRERVRMLLIGAFLAEILICR